MTKFGTDDAARGWDIEYAAGRYRDEPPLPLVLVGLDISERALVQLPERASERRTRLVQGDVTALRDGATYRSVIGIQVFKHGDRAAAPEQIAATQARVGLGGLFCLRVNAVGTELEYEHYVIECNIDGGFTVRYLAGPKAGLNVQFFAETELSGLFADDTAVVRPRLARTWRTPRARGH